MNRYQQKRILAALDCDDQLTPWEYDFIDSLADKGEDYELSERQNEILNRIAQKTGR